MEEFVEVCGSKLSVFRIRMLVRTLKCQTLFLSWKREKELDLLKKNEKFIKPWFISMTDSNFQL